MRKSLILIIVFFIIIPVTAQTFNYSGFIQTWFSYAQQHEKDNNAFGFNLRRAKISTFGDLTDKIKWRAQFVWINKKPILHDVYIYFNIINEFKLKIGQFPAPGSPSGSLISSSKLDFIERAMFIQKWGMFSNLKSYRALGVQVDGNLLDNKVYYALMFANPKTDEIFSPSLKSDTYQGDSSILFSGRLELRPIEDLRIGGFYMKSEDSSENSKNESYGVSLFYVNNKLILKSEYIEGNSETSPYGAPNEYKGYMIKTGYKFNKLEPVFRYDYYKKWGGFGLLIVENYKNYTFGLNYYYNKNIKIQTNYVLRDEMLVDGLGEIENNIFYINLQYRF